MVLDEAHRARRRTRSKSQWLANARGNNLLEFLRRISPRTKSLLLATATPVQLHPIEAFDLLDALARGSDAVLGSAGSRWRQPEASLNLLLGRAALPTDLHERWDWLRNPLPPAAEDRPFELLRRSLGLPADAPYAPGKAFDGLRAADKQRIDSGFKQLLERHNPYIRSIILRTREQLESTVDPETAEPYLARVEVRLHGESSEDAIILPPYLRDAYTQAEAFCTLLAERANAGFFRTMLLRRMGSTIEAGRLTVTRILNDWTDAYDEDEDDEGRAPQRTLTEDERRLLSGLGAALESNNDRDPKCAVVSRLLLDEGWLQHGCIVFSQYYDSIRWLATQLSIDMPDEPIGIYAGADRSGLMRGDVFKRHDRDALKDAVRLGTLRLVLGTDAASEGLEPATTGHADQPGPSLEPLPPGTAQRPHPAHRAGSASRGRLQYALRGLSGGPRA